jgi:hypothetical protein
VHFSSENCELCFAEQPGRAIEAAKFQVSRSQLCSLLALPTKARIFVFTFIIEYSSLRDFGPKVNRSIFI